jgi:hypothetical protein
VKSRDSEAASSEKEVLQELPQSRTVPGLSDAAGDWLCAWCHNRVANERDRCAIDGQNQFAFTNQEGIRFEIITFSETLGCRQSGKPTLEHTWFPNHTWSYCQCVECGSQLGWHFEGEKVFAGLIQTRIVRALNLRN